jgi:RNA polymerase sigma factor for flagellar operon FliA
LHDHHCANAESASVSHAAPPAGPLDRSSALARFHESLHLVQPIAERVRRILGLPVELAEVVSWGQSGLLAASQRYEPSLGVPFPAFARFRIRGAILDGVRQSANLSRRTHQRVCAHQRANAYAESAGLSETGGDAEQGLRDHLAGMATAIATGLLFDGGWDDGTCVAVDHTPSPEERCLRVEAADGVRAAVNRLPSVEAHVIRRMYFEDQRLEDVARELGSSKTSMCRVHVRAIQRLTRLLEDRPSLPS